MYVNTWKDTCIPAWNVQHSENIDKKFGSKVFSLILLITIYFWKHHKYVLIKSITLSPSLSSSSKDSLSFISHPTSWTFMIFINYFLHFWVQLILSIYLWVWGYPWQHGKPISVHTAKKKRKKINLPPPVSINWHYPLNYWGYLRNTFLLLLEFITGFILCKLCVDNQAYHPCYIQKTIFLLIFWISHAVFPPYSWCSLNLKEKGVDINIPSTDDQM